MNRIIIRSIFFIIIFASSLHAQISKPITYSTTLLREGDLHALLNDVKSNDTLQLERLAAYFFHQKINDYRLKNNLNSLYWDDRMWLAARNHNLYLWKLKGLSHSEINKNAFFTGIEPSDRIQHVTYGGFNMQSYGENCLFFEEYYDKKEINTAIDIADREFKQWRNSPPHNANMLHSAHFAHGTSFIYVDERVYGTTNFGNQSAFIENEISNFWDKELSDSYPQMKLVNPKLFKQTEWTLKVAEDELRNVIKSNMPKSKSLYNKDLELAAQKGSENINQPNVRKTNCKSRYLKASKKPLIKLIFSNLIEKQVNLVFCEEDLKNKSFLATVSKKLTAVLPNQTKIDVWGAVCKLIPEDDKFVCIIDVIYKLKK